MEKVQSNNPYKSTTLFPGFPAGEFSIEMQHCVFEANNIVDFTQVQTLEECRLLCEDASECQYFTFYDNNYYLGVHVFSSPSAKSTRTMRLTMDALAMPASL